MLQVGGKNERIRLKIDPCPLSFRNYSAVICGTDECFAARTSAYEWREREAVGSAGSPIGGEK